MICMKSRHDDCTCAAMLGLFVFHVILVAVRFSSSESLQDVPKTISCAPNYSPTAKSVVKAKIGRAHV